MYLFDTDTITNIFKKRPSKNLFKKLKKLDRSKQFISTITIYEIIYGAFKSPQPEYHTGKLEQILLPSVNIVGFDIKSSYICGKLHAELEQKGQSLSLADLQIASIAIANGLILVTGNTKHFERIKVLKVENWF
jgi:tRNA(fMet)-specific endonuclease VapC